jgi:hypothetical protein
LRDARKPRSNVDASSPLCDDATNISGVGGTRDRPSGPSLRGLHSWFHEVAAMPDGSYAVPLRRCPRSRPHPARRDRPMRRVQAHRDRTIEAAAFDVARVIASNAASPDCTIESELG